LPSAIDKTDKNMNFNFIAPTINAAEVEDPFLLTHLTMLGYQLEWRPSIPVQVQGATSLPPEVKQ